MEDRVHELTTRYYAGLEVLQALANPKTIDELAANLDRDAVEVTDLEDFDRVSHDGETVHPLE